MIAPDPLAIVKAVSDRFKNPFGISVPCEAGTAVTGYGDPAADFHVIGDHPGCHGGAMTGIPFTESHVGREIQSVCEAVGLMGQTDSAQFSVNNLFLNYCYLCPKEPGKSPTVREYEDHERFFDAELRAVNAHILLPVGRHATDHVLKSYTTQYRKQPRSMLRRHGRDIRGRGFLVVPIADPTAWRDGDRSRIIQTLTRILDSDYRQTKGVATRIG